MSFHDYAESAFLNGNEKDTLRRRVIEDPLLGLKTLEYLYWHALRPTKLFRFIFTETLDAADITALDSIVANDGTPIESDHPKHNIRQNVGATATVDWSTSTHQTIVISANTIVTMVNPPEFESLFLYVEYSANAVRPSFTNSVMVTNNFIGYSEQISSIDMLIMFWDRSKYWITSQHKRLEDT